MKRGIVLFSIALLSACRGGPVDRPDLHNTQTVINDNRIKTDDFLKITDITANSKNSIHLVQVRGEVSPHYHASRVETVYILSGTGLLVIRQGGVNEMNTVVKAGDIITIPAGAVHSFHNQGDIPAIALSIFTPPFDGKDRISIDSQR